MSIQSERQPNACVAFPSVFDRPHHMVVDITYRSPVIYSVTYLGRKSKHMFDSYFYFRIHLGN